MRFHATESAEVLANASFIDAGELQLLTGARTSSDPGDRVRQDLPYHEAVAVFKKDLIQDTLGRTAGNQSQAAERLGLQRTYLARLITNLGLRKSK